MSAIPASSVNLKTMADGTLRISFDVEPSQAQDAFKLFAAPGTQVAIAALKDGSIHAQKLEPEPPKEPIGDACRRAVMWCKEPQFWAFLNQDPVCSSNDLVTNEKEAADTVRFICCVESRRELDTDNEANKAWHRLIREPYRIYLESLNKSPQRMAA